MKGNARAAVEIMGLLVSLRRRHHISPDCWYTCPKAVEEDPDEGCCDNERPYACDCGAEVHNAALDRLAALLPALAAAPTPEAPARPPTAGEVLAAWQAWDASGFHGRTPVREFRWREQRWGEWLDGWDLVRIAKAEDWDPSLPQPGLRLVSGEDPQGDERGPAEIPYRAAATIDSLVKVVRRLVHDPAFSDWCSDSDTLAALNGALGESRYGLMPWDGDHVVSATIREIDGHRHG